MLSHVMCAFILLLTFLLLVSQWCRLGFRPRW